MELYIHFDNKPWSGQTDCYITQLDHMGKRTIAKPVELVFEPMSSHEAHPPTLTFGPLDKAAGFFEALTQALARAGYVAENKDAGELKATKLHLADMQRIVFTNTQK